MSLNVEPAIHVGTSSSVTTEIVARSAALALTHQIIPHPPRVTDISKPPDTSSVTSIFFAMLTQAPEIPGGMEFP